jgi:hypothetical protein
LGLICQSGQNWAAKIARSTIRTFFFFNLGTQGEIRTKLQNLSGQKFEISDPASRPIFRGPPIPYIIAISRTACVQVADAGIKQHFVTDSET